MELEVDVEQFLSDLPNQIEQARRQLFSGNLNALEFWQRKIEDFLNVLNVLCRQFEGIDADGALAANCNQLIAEIQAIHGMFEGIISADGDYMAELNYDYDASAANDLHEEGTIGRPRKSITREEMELLYSIHKSWKEVAALLGTSERTIQRIRRETGMTTSSRTGPRSTYSDISHVQLCTVIREILNILPNAGETYVLGACRSRGIHVQRSRLRDAINTVDPINRALRRTVSIVRRQYSVRAPNSLW